MKLKIDPELDSLFEDLQLTSEWTYESLKEDIKKNGILDKLVVNQEGIIVCGHQRFKIAQELNIPKKDIPIKVENFKTREEMIDRAINDNIHRRNMNNFERGLLGLKLLPQYEKQAKQRQGKKTSIKHFIDVGQALILVAKRVGMSHTTLNKVRYIQNSPYTDSNDIAKLKKGIISVSKFYNYIKKKETDERIEKERFSDEQRRLKNKGNRFSNDVDDFLTKQLKKNKDFITHPNPDEDKAINQKQLQISGDGLVIIAKTEESKRLLAKFKHPDDKINKISNKGQTFSLLTLNYVIDLMKKIDSDATITYNPLTIDNEHFKVMVGGK